MNASHQSGPPHIPALPSPGDPLVLSDGRVIQPDSLSDLGLADPKPLDVLPKDFRATTARNLEEIAADPKTIVASGAVISLTLLGISDREIMETLRFSREQLEKIRDQDVYAEFFNAFYKELINANSASLQARIAGYAHGALTNVAVIAATAKRDDVRLAANRDILDRAGTKVADAAERDKGKTTSLKISILRGDEVVASNIDISVQ